MTRALKPGRVLADADKLCIGRPRKQPPSDAEKVIREATAGGANKRAVASALGCDLDVLTRWMDEDPALKSAFDDGRETERRTLHNVVFKQATEGIGKDALLAAFYILNSKHGYRSEDSQDAGNRVQITFNLPGPQPIKDYIEALPPSLKIGRE